MDMLLQDDATRVTSSTAQLVGALMQALECRVLSIARAVHHDVSDWTAARLTGGWGDCLHAVRAEKRSRQRKKNTLENWGESSRAQTCQRRRDFDDVALAVTGTNKQRDANVVLLWW